MPCTGTHGEGKHLGERIFNRIKTLPPHSPDPHYQDNKSAITLATGGTHHKRSKHFGIEFGALREYVKLGELEIFYRPTENLPADMLTKSLPPEKFKRFREETMGEKRTRHIHLGACRK